MPCVIRVRSLTCQFEHARQVAARRSRLVPHCDVLVATRLAAQSWNDIKAKKVTYKYGLDKYVVKATHTVWTCVENNTLQAVSSFPFNSIRCDMRHQGTESHFNFDTACTEHQGRCPTTGERYSRLCLQDKWLQEDCGSLLTVMFFPPHALRTCYRRMFLFSLEVFFPESRVLSLPLRRIRTAAHDAHSASRHLWTPLSPPFKDERRQGREEMSFCSMA